MAFQTGFFTEQASHPVSSFNDTAKRPKPMQMPGPGAFFICEQIEGWGGRAPHAAMNTKILFPFLNRKSFPLPSARPVENFAFPSDPVLAGLWIYVCLYYINRIALDIINRPFGPYQPPSFRLIQRLASVIAFKQIRQCQMVEPPAIRHLSIQFQPASQGNLPACVPIELQLGPLSLTGARPFRQGPTAVAPL